MSTEALEKKLIGVESLSGLEEYATIDVYGVGTTVLYSFDPPKPPFGDLGFPKPFEPAENYGFGGPGEARCIFPGLVERTRPEHEHEPYGLHKHSELHNIFNNEGYFKPIKKEHIPVDERK